MIGRLNGILEWKSPPHLLIEVGGVGYEVQAPLSTFYRLPNLGESLTLFVHFHVREDAQQLYGFTSPKERALFRTLIKISGVGPKMGLTLLSGMDIDVFLQCVETRDTSLLVKLPGVGKKTAERLLIEMAGKLKGELLEEDVLKTGPSSTQTPPSRHAAHAAATTPHHEALSALIGLGYRREEAVRVLSAVSASLSLSSAVSASAVSSSATSPSSTASAGQTTTENSPASPSTETLIRLALKSLGKHYA